MAQIALGDWRQCGLKPQPKTAKLYADGSVHSKQHSDLTAWERLIKYREQETGGVKDTEEGGGGGGGMSGGDRRMLWVMRPLSH